MNGYLSLYLIKYLIVFKLRLQYKFLIQKIIIFCTQKCPRIENNFSLTNDAFIGNFHAFLPPNSCGWISEPRWRLINATFWKSPVVQVTKRCSSNWLLHFFCSAKINYDIHLQIFSMQKSKFNVIRLTCCILKHFLQKIMMNRIKGHT